MTWLCSLAILPSNSAISSGPWNTSDRYFSYLLCNCFMKTLRYLFCIRHVLSYSSLSAKFLLHFPSPPHAHRITENWTIPDYPKQLLAQKWSKRQFRSRPGLFTSFVCIRRYFFEKYENSFTTLSNFLLKECWFLAVHGFDNVSAYEFWLPTGWPGKFLLQAF